MEVTTEQARPGRRARGQRKTKRKGKREKIENKQNGNM